MRRRNPPHKWWLRIQPEAKRAFDRLQLGHKRAIFRHLEELLNANDPYTIPFVEVLKDKKYERTRKFRVGNYREFFFGRSGGSYPS